jgi:hypothetical protein
MRSGLLQLSLHCQLQVEPFEQAAILFPITPSQEFRVVLTLPTSSGLNDAFGESLNRVPFHPLLVVTVDVGQWARVNRQPVDVLSSLPWMIAFSGVVRCVRVGRARCGTMPCLGRCRNLSFPR